MTWDKGVKLHGGTLYRNENNVLWDTRQTDFQFTIGESYMSKRPEPALHTVLSIDEKGVVELQRIGGNRKSHSMIQSFASSYLIQEKKKHTLKKKEAEKAKRDAERLAAAMQRIGLPQPAAETPTSSSEQVDVQELGKDLTALIHDRMDELEEKLTDRIHSRMEALQAELTEQLNSQHGANHRVLSESLEQMVASITTQGKETETRLIEAIIKGLS